MSLLEDSKQTSISGYDYSTSRSAESPVSDSDLSELEQTAGWTSADAGVLARYADLMAESMAHLSLDSFPGNIPGDWNVQRTQL
jgi:hypothetical protein